MNFYLYKDKSYSPGRRHRIVNKLKTNIDVYRYNDSSVKRHILNRFSFCLPGVLSSLLKTKTTCKYLGIYSVYNGLSNLHMGLSFDTTTINFSNKVRLKLKEIPVGQYVSSIEIQPGKGPVLCRSAGVFAKVESIFSQNYVVIKLPSGSIRSVPSDCFANIGPVINEKHNQEILGKAGCNRWKGKRPHTRGIAKNPVDHAHGGRTNGGICSRTPNGKITKGPKTRSKKTIFLQKKYILQ